MPRVLVVDDSAVDRHLAGKLLTKTPEFTVAFADDGAQALAAIEAQTPDIVVTDLQMPNLNGLELVEAVRERYPLVPVILMTAHGSEEVAVQALLAGAASYVPKNELPRHLLETVQNVLAAVRSDQQQRRLMECVDRRRLRYVLDNDTSLVPPLVDQLQQEIAAVGLVDDTSRVQVAVAVEEALLNALYHGNLELSSEELEELRSKLIEMGGKDPVLERSREPQFRERRIYVEADIGKDEARITIRDDGRGFNAADAPDPADPATLSQPRGRGLVLMRTFMDEVHRNAAGNEVCLVKRRTANGQH